jgi:glycine cleavage system regulatory protein
MQSLVITIVGPDRPGLVETLARTIASHGGSWVESSLSHLAGQFAGVVRATVEDDGSDALEGALTGLTTDALRVVVQRGHAPTDADVRKTVELDLVGSDRPGIVQAVSRALAELGVNVESLETACEGAPMSGGQLFKAAATLHLPGEMPVRSVRAAIEAVAADLMVDIVIKDD